MTVDKWHQHHYKKQILFAAATCYTYIQNSHSFRPHFELFVSGQFYIKAVTIALGY